MSAHRAQHAAVDLARPRLPGAGRRDRRHARPAPPARTGADFPGPRARKAWPARAAAACAAVLAGLALFAAAAPPALAQAVLVSNSGQPTTTELFVDTSTAGAAVAVQFSTGSNAEGYSLHTIAVFLGSAARNQESVTVRVLEDASDAPGSVRYTLTTPSSLHDGTGTMRAEFTAPSGATLEKDTSYWVELEAASLIGHVANINYDATGDDGEDSAGQSDWSIGNRRWFRTSGGSYSSTNVNSGSVPRIEIKGFVGRAPSLDGALVENTEHSRKGTNPAGLTASEAGRKVATSFETGSHEQAYELDAVVLYAFSVSSDESFTVRVLSDNSGLPGNVLYTLTTPDFTNEYLQSASGVAARFEAPPDAALEKDTRYWVQAGDYSGSGFEINLDVANSNDQLDPLGQGWTIGNDTFWANDENSWNASRKLDDPLVMGILGSARELALLSLEVEDDGTPLSFDHPAFSTDATTYYLSVANSVDVLTIKAELTSGLAGAGHFFDASGNALTDRSADDGFQVRVGVNQRNTFVFKLEPDAADGPTYTLHVGRTARQDEDAGTCAVLWCAAVTSGIDAGDPPYHGYSEGSEEDNGLIGGIDPSAEFILGGETYVVERIAMNHDTAKVDLRFDRVLPEGVYALQQGVYGAGLGFLLNFEFPFYADGFTRDFTLDIDRSVLANAFGIRSEVRLRVLSPDATLAELQLIGPDGTEYEFNHPDFTGAGATHYVSVPNSADVLTFKAKKSHSAATVEYFDAVGDALGDLGGEDGHQVALDPGANLVRVKVTAEDGLATETFTMGIISNSHIGPGQSGSLRSTLTGRKNARRTVSMSAPGMSYSRSMSALRG